MLSTAHSQQRCAAASADQHYRQSGITPVPLAWYHRSRAQFRCNHTLTVAHSSQEPGPKCQSPFHPPSARASATQSRSRHAITAADQMHRRAPQLSAFTAAVLLSWSAVAPPGSWGYPNTMEQVRSVSPESQASHWVDRTCSATVSPDLVDDLPPAIQACATGKRTVSGAAPALSLDMSSVPTLGGGDIKTRHLGVHDATAQVCNILAD